MSEWWKVSPDEMRRLLGVDQAPSPSPSDETPRVSEAREPVPTSAGPPSDPPHDPHGRRRGGSAYTPVHFMLARALPRLWAFARRKSTSRKPRGLHSKLRELIAWALEKDGYVIEPQAPTPYAQDEEMVQGRLELLVKGADGAPVLAIETDWAANSASLLKLQAWHQKGVPTLWILGVTSKPDTLSRFRAVANRTLQQSTVQWLAIYHLEHGWVRAQHRTGSTA